MRSKRRRSAAPLALALVLIGILAVAMTTVAGCGSDKNDGTAPAAPGGTAAPPTASADAAPDFSGVTLEGLDVSLSEYRGRPLVLAFMASW